MPKLINKAAAMSDRLARRSKQVDPRRLGLLGKILEESSSIALNDGASQQSARQALESHSRLLDLIEELRSVESPCKLPERNDKSWSNFLTWINAEAAFDCSTTLAIEKRKPIKKEEAQASDEQEFAVYTKIPLRKEDTIFSVPRKVMMSTETVMDDDDLFDFIRQDSIASSMQNVVLVLHLLNEYSKGDKSYWAPYLSILPSKILPVLEMDKHKLNCLSASSHIFEALKMIRAISRQYTYFFKRLQATNLPLCRDFTFEYYSWGVSVVCSRQNEIPPLNKQSSSTSVIHALIPILDMCNHNRLSNQATFEDNQSRLVASKTLIEGDEITINYGIRSSGDFYIHNGFVPDEVPYDIVPLSIVLNPQNSLYETKVKLLKTLNMPIFARFRLTRNDYENRHKRDPHLTMFLIVYLLSETELELIMNSDNPVGVADSIYEYVQYNDQTITSQNESNGLSTKPDILAMQTRLFKCIKEYLSKRAAIGIALIDRALSEYKDLDRNMLLMLQHEKSIYSSHIINCS